jgi:hypothetical protein
MAASGNGNGRSGTRLGTKLALGWLLIVALACLWAKAAGQGPIAWIETEYSLRTASILGANILFLVLILGLPAIWVLWGAVIRSEHAAGKDETSRRRLFGRYAAVLLGLAGVCLAAAVAGGILAARAPDGREAAVPITPDELTRQNVPRHRVAIDGVVDIGAVTGFRESLRGGERYWLYSGFRPRAGAKGSEDASETAPIAIFLERSLNARPEARPARPEAVEGYLILNGLPAYARIALERNGVRIASPHYLLRDGENGQRDDYFGMVMLGLIFAFICGAIGGTLMLMALVGISAPPQR